MASVRNQRFGKAKQCACCNAVIDVGETATVRDVVYETHVFDPQNPGTYERVGVCESVVYSGACWQALNKGDNAYVQRHRLSPKGERIDALQEALNKLEATHAVENLTSARDSDNRIVVYPAETAGPCAALIGIVA